MRPHDKIPILFHLLATSSKSIAFPCQSKRVLGGHGLQYRRIKWIENQNPWGFEGDRHPNAVGSVREGIWTIIRPWNHPWTTWWRQFLRGTIKRYIGYRGTWIIGGMGTDVLPGANDIHFLIAKYAIAFLLGGKKLVDSRPQVIDIPLLDGQRILHLAALVHFLEYNTSFCHSLWRFGSFMRRLEAEIRLGINGTRGSTEVQRVSKGVVFKTIHGSFVISLVQPASSFSISVTAFSKSLWFNRSLLLKSDLASRSISASRSGNNSIFQLFVVMNRRSLRSRPPVAFLLTKAQREKKNYHFRIGYQKGRTVCWVMVNFNFSHKAMHSLVVSLSTFVCERWTDLTSNPSNGSHVRIKSTKRDVWRSILNNSSTLLKNLGCSVDNVCSRDLGTDSTSNINSVEDGCFCGDTWGVVTFELATVVLGEVVVATGLGGGLKPTPSTWFGVVSTVFWIFLGDFSGGPLERGGSLVFTTFSCFVCFFSAIIGRFFVLIGAFKETTSVGCFLKTGINVKIIGKSHTMWSSFWHKLRHKVQKFQLVTFKLLQQFIHQVPNTISEFRILVSYFCLWHCKINCFCEENEKTQQIYVLQQKFWWSCDPFVRKRASGRCVLSATAETHRTRAKPRQQMYLERANNHKQLLIAFLFQKWKNFPFPSTISEFPGPPVDLGSEFNEKQIESKYLHTTVTQTIPFQ